MLKILLGSSFFFLAYIIAAALHLPFLETILGQLAQGGVLVAMIIFQKEVRRLFLWIGEAATVQGRMLFQGLFQMQRLSKPEADITPIIEAAKALAGSNTGALIVISRKDALSSYQETGEPIRSIVSKRLLMAIFNKLSPLHDGAVLIHNDKIAAARCILPVTDRNDLPSHLGLRHRAALGMAETTEALVLIVSEETGQISIAHKGEIANNLFVQEARAAIYEYLQNNESS